MKGLQECSRQLSSGGEFFHGATLSILYESPLLLHLLSAGRWQEAEQKLSCLFQELKRAEAGQKMAEERGQHGAGKGERQGEQWQEALVLQELLTEIYCMCNTSFCYTLRRQGRNEVTFHHNAAQPLPIGGVRELEQWALRGLRLVKEANGDKEATCQADIVREVKRIVMHQLNEDITLQKLADEVYLHPKYLSWLFKHETGEGIIEYVSRVKMEHAAESLQTSRKKVYEIAAGLGFRNPSYFIQVFKGRYGMTPQQFRNRAESG